ncbi:hypothetical protein PsorP6_013927 [Peronosclerospora sorghi]|uniref:Uncharacterized protein n=1 Tax=Peronosclerospora sorghi TaxID=230839 RepID=A0ACC0VIX5_9STRA|nr:hypothetical protein PsorP6_013927 [Peronosclerospora sorghi]
MFDSARDVYEEGICTVVTVRDFSMIFDAYVKFFDAIRTVEMDIARKGNKDDEGDKDDDVVDHQFQFDRISHIFISREDSGRLPKLWIQFARFYDEHNDLNNARAIFKKAAEVGFRNPHELAAVYCEWAEMEIRHENLNKR